MRFVFLPSLVGLFCYMFHNSNTAQILPAVKLNQKVNTSNNIRYTKKFKGGKLFISAKTSELIASNHVLLKDMVAVFEKDGKRVTISGESCNLKMDEKKAYIQNNVVIKTINTSCNTKFAVVDFENNNLYSDSKVEGVRSGANFVADGFSLNEKGLINLVHAVIKN